LFGMFYRNASPLRDDGTFIHPELLLHA